MKRVLTIGTFDMLHPGHIELLEGCRALGDEVYVAVNRGEFVQRFKGREPVIPLWGRMLMLKSLRQVDHVLVNMGDEQASKAIAAVGPQVIAVGSDWQGKDYLRQLGVTERWLDERGITVVYVPRTTEFSTTHLRELAYIGDRELQRAPAGDAGDFAADA